MQREGRMKREMELLVKNPPPGISCCAVDDRLDKLEAQILGSEDTPYQNGVFKLDVGIPERYPFEPPRIQFVTPIYHPNIDTTGTICLDVFKMPPKGAWKPSLNISTALTSIQVLMAEPNPEDPLLPDVSEEFKYNRPLFNKKAREWTEKHAIHSVSNAAKSELNN